MNVNSPLTVANRSAINSAVTLSLHGSRLCCLLFPFIVYQLVNLLALHMHPYTLRSLMDCASLYAAIILSCNHKMIEHSIGYPSQLTRWSSWKWMLSFPTLVYQVM